MKMKSSSNSAYVCSHSVSTYTEVHTRLVGRHERYNSMSEGISGRNEHSNHISHRHVHSVAGFVLSALLSCLGLGLGLVDP